MSRTILLWNKLKRKSSKERKDEHCAEYLAPFGANIFLAECGTIVVGVADTTAFDDDELALGAILQALSGSIFIENNCLWRNSQSFTMLSIFKILCTLTLLLAVALDG